MTLYEEIITRMINKGKTDEQITRAIYKAYGMPAGIQPNQYTDLIAENLANDIKSFRAEIEKNNALYQKISEEIAQEFENDN